MSNALSSICFFGLPFSGCCEDCSVMFRWVFGTTIVLAMNIGGETTLFWLQTTIEAISDHPTSFVQRLDSFITSCPIKFVR
jgi:hypothetical protein